MGRWIEEAERPISCARCHHRIDVGQRFWYVKRGTYLCELCGGIAEHEDPVVGEVEEGVLADLALLDDEASKGAVAKLMIHNARRIDNGDVADRDIAPLYKELRQMLTQLHLQYPPVAEDDETAKAQRRREEAMLLDNDWKD